MELGLQSHMRPTVPNVILNEHIFLFHLTAGFTSKRETVSLKLVLLLDNGLQNLWHFIVNFGQGV